MNSPSHFIPRKFQTLPGEEIPEDWCTATGVFVVIGEPGTGKSSFLTEVARHRGHSSIHARQLMNRSTTDDEFIVDGLDEVAIRSHGDLERLIDRLGESKAPFILLAMRSSCWTSDISEYCRRSFGRKPALLSLLPFGFDEQKRFYLAEQPNGEFEVFRRNIYNVGLGPLLGNPQLLKLLIRASGQGSFQTKSAAFDLASRNAAQALTSGRTPIPSEKKIAAANEIFAKLLLSNSGVVAASEVSAHDSMPIASPYIRSLLRSCDFDEREILETSLFRLSGDPDCHEPIHRTVAEHGAAQYLAGRIRDPRDELSLTRVLALVAPNNIVRPDLRGLAGWLGSIGSSETQKAMVKLAPYDVLTDGDAARLGPGETRELLRSLADLADRNPYFRNEDVWRVFSAQITQLDSGLVNEYLADTARPQQLRGLLLEVLIESEQQSTSGTLIAMALNEREDLTLRKLAVRALGKIESCNLERIFADLLNLRSAAGYSLAAHLASTNFSNPTVDQVFQIIKPTPQWHWSSHDESFELVWHVVRTLSTSELMSILERLQDSYSCHCGQEGFRCECDIAFSKDLCRVLDVYVENTPVCDPATLARFIQPMRFQRELPPQRSASVCRLQEDVALRRAVQAELVSKAIAENRRPLFHLGVGRHSGIRPRNGDREHLSNRFVEQGDWDTWMKLIPDTHFEADRPLRIHMKQQARDHVSLLARWQVLKRQRKAENMVWFRRFGRRPNRAKQRASRSAKIRGLNQRFFEENQKKIVTGENEAWISVFANHVLHGDRPDDEEWKVFDDMTLPLKVLRSALPRLESYVPNLAGLAQYAVEGKTTNAMLWVHAAAVAWLRLEEDLGELSDMVLQALMTRVDCYPEGVSSDERKILNDLVIARLFDTLEKSEDFLRAYVEPQLQANKRYPPVLWLNRFDCFHPLRAKLAVEWISNFPDLQLETTKQLFSIIQTNCTPEMIRQVVSAKIELHFPVSPQICVRKSVGGRGAALSAYILGDRTFVLCRSNSRKCCSFAFGVVA
ncbi:MAG: hypothetical protein R3E66_12640 [bacterium]